MAALDMVFDQLIDLFRRAPDGNEIVLVLQRLDHDYNFGSMSAVEAQVGDFDFNTDIQENGEMYLQALWEGTHRVPTNVRPLVFSCLDRLAQHHVMRGYLLENHMMDMVNTLAREGGETATEESYAARMMCRCGSDRELDLFLDPVGNERLPRILRDALIRHADNMNTETVMGRTAFEEELMLLSAIYLDYPEKMAEYALHLDLVVDFLNEFDIPTRPLDRPFSSLVLFFVRLLLIPTRYDRLSIWQDIEAPKLLQLLEAAIDFYDHSYGNIHMDRLLKVIHVVSCIGSTLDRVEIRRLMIPSFAERRRPMGLGDTLVHKMVYVIIVGTRNNKLSIAHLMLLMSNIDKYQLAFNYGYYCAAEILYLFQIPIPTVSVVRERLAEVAATSTFVEYDTMTGQLLQEMYTVQAESIIRSHQVFRAAQLIYRQTLPGALEAVDDTEDDAATVILPENQPAAVVEDEGDADSEATTVILAKNQPANIIESVEVDDEENEDVETDFNMASDLEDVEMDLD